MWLCYYNVWAYGLINEPNFASVSILSFGPDFLSVQAHSVATVLFWAPSPLSVSVQFVPLTQSLSLILLLFLTLYLPHLSLFQSLLLLTLPPMLWSHVCFITIPVYSMPVFILADYFAVLGVFLAFSMLIHMSTSDSGSDLLSVLAPVPGPWVKHTLVSNLHV